MTAIRQNRPSERLTQLSQALLTTIDFASQPAVFRRIRQAFLLALGFWILNSLWSGAWSFFPVTTQEVDVTRVINPPEVLSVGISAEPIDINALVSANLFGEPGAPPEAQVPESLLDTRSGMSEAEAEEALAGIEEGAPETRLPLRLRGVVSSTSAGLGQAVIEHKKAQDLYRVGDELPVGSEVVLAKVLPDRAVLDNEGRYELLKLFEESGLVAQVEEAPEPPPRAPRNARRAQAPRVQPKLSDEERAAQAAEAAIIAASYREKLYTNPQSIGELVRVAPVRDEGSSLQGYRVNPGKNAAAFAALGFEPGDIVTAVNGLSFDDPSAAVRVYNEMRSATVAVFQLERDGQSLALSVDIGNAP
ncbi:MAG: type II secretion system protein GspC [Pseudomonadota bacterium]